MNVKRKPTINASATRFKTDKYTLSHIAVYLSWDCLDRVSRHFITLT